MESNYQQLRYDLDSRNKNIIELQGQLLRVDYQYALIIKDLKQKYRQIAFQFKNNVTILNEIKKQNKKLQLNINSKCRENQHLVAQIEDANNRNIYLTESINRLKLENQELRSQIKYLEANQSKYQLKAQQNNKKKLQYKQQCIKMGEKIQSLEKQLKRMSFKNKQLQELVEQEVLQTQNRIQSIGYELMTKNTLHQTKMVLEKDYQTNNNTISKMIIKNNSEQLINDWESDMKKLKNCIEYGSSYIVVFDPMNLDRMLSRQIFNFFKKCLKQKANAQAQLLNLKESNHKTVQELKMKLISFQEQIQRIKQIKNRPILIDTLMQTQNRNNYSTQKAVLQLSELNTKLKLRTSALIQCIQILALRSVALGHQLFNSHTNTMYYKAIYRKQIKYQASKPVNRLRKVLYSVLFIKFLTKKRSQTSKLFKQQKSFKDNYQKIQIQTIKLDKQGIKNVQIQKLREILMTDRSQLHMRTSQIVSYYEFKLKNKLKQQQKIRQQLLI